MTDVHTAEARCEACGAELPPEGGPCAVCAPVLENDEAHVLAETIESASCDAAGEPECGRTPLWTRLSVAAVYLAVSAAFGYGSVGFFDGNFTTSSDWVFGAMAIALALVALLGVKESLFPSDWTPE